VGPLALSFAWGAIAAIAVLASTSRPGASTGWWLVAALFTMPASSWVLDDSPPGSDRAAHLALLFLAGLAGLLLQAVNRRALVAFALLLGVLSIDRSKVWRSEQAVWMEASRLNPHAVAPKIRLSMTLPPAQAFEVLQSALEDHPGDPQVLARIAELRLPVETQATTSEK
jgi:hypothetical protein